MINLGKFTYDEDEVINCVNFMKNSDVIFSGTLSKEDFIKYNFKKPKIVFSKNNLITFINLEIAIQENDIVYCQLDYLEVLFKLIKKLDLKNIKVISTQSDRKIDKKIYNRKPKCISKWYSINVDYNHPKLVPIPLGIASYRNTKSVIFSDFINLKHKIKVDKSFYTNFNVNTNYFHRIKAQRAIAKNLGQSLKENIDYGSYLLNLHSSVYCLAPWGNGSDTHRFWESLYSGTIPVTKSCIHYESFSDFPMILVDSYDEINSIQQDFNFFEKNIEKLNINWWIDEIRENIIENSSIRQLSLTKSRIMFLDYYLIKLKYKDKLIKTIFTFLRKTHKKLNLVLKQT